MPISGDINWTEEELNEYEKRGIDNPENGRESEEPGEKEGNRIDIEWAKRQARNSIGYEDMGWVVVPESEEEVIEYAKAYEKEGEAVKGYFRTESPLTNWIYTGARKAKYWIEGIFEGKESEAFDLDAKMEEDGISEFDKELYEGVTSQREYEYIKEGIEREREDRRILNEDGGIFRVVPEILEFAMFPIAGKAVGAIGSSVKVAKGVTLTDGVNKILSPLSSEVMKDIVKASGVGAALGVADYAAGYDIRGEEAIARAGIYALAGGAFAGVVHGGKAVINKIANEAMKRASVTDGKKMVLGEMEKEWENILSSGGIGDKAVEVLTTKSPVSKTHPYMMLFSKNEEVNRMARELFTFNEEWVLGAELRPMEFRVNKANAKDAEDFKESLKILKGINKEVERYDGTTSREWFARGFYGGEEVLPEGLPHKEKIIGIINKLEKKVEDIRGLRNEVIGDSLDLEESFLPYEESGKNFSIEKIIDRQKRGIQGSKPRYVPRTWNREAILENEEELRELMKQGLINAEAIRLGEKVTVKKLERYAGSQKLKEAVDRQIYHLTSSKIAGKGKSSPERRSIRVDDRALYKFFSKDPLMELYDFLRRERTELEFKKSVKDAGYQDWAEFSEKIKKGYEEKTGTLRGEEKKKVLREAEQTEKLLEQVETIISNRYVGKENLLGNKKVQEALESATNCMYSALLGATSINSLSDIKGMVVRCGLGNVVRNLSGSLVDSIENGIRGILKLPKSEQREVLDALVLGFEDTRINAQLRLLPARNGELFYGPSKVTLGEKSVYYSGKLSNLTYIVSGSRWLDETLRRTAAKLVLNELGKDAKYAASVKEMIKKKEFSEEIEDIVYRKVNRMMTKPTMADVPSIAYNELGKLFYALKSWSFANSTNYLYPILKGSFKKRNIAKSVLTVVMMQMAGKYIKRLSQGNPYDLSREEEREEFEKDVFNQSLDDMAGVIGVHMGSFEGVINSIRYKDSSKLIKDTIPIMGYGDYICSLLGGIYSLYNGTLTYKGARKALRTLPLNNVWWIEGGTNALAEKISGGRRDKR